MKRAVITGIGAVTPLGNSIDTFWDNLLNAKSVAAPITKFDPTLYKTKFACEVKNFDPLQFLEKSEARKMDLYTQFAVSASDECIRDSQIDLKSTNLTKMGVILASGIGGIINTEDEMISFANNNLVPRFSPFLILKMIPNMAAGYISIRNGLHGVSYATVSACTSSNHAIVDAFNYIRLGKANVILAGGADATITRACVGGFNSLRALSEQNNDPSTASRPFDKNRNGFVMGEGAGVLMVEELEHALARGAKIYCELVGGGCASDAYHITASHPEGYGAQLAMEEAIAEAGLTAADVDYINAHATSTPLGDISECKAISKVFADNLKNVHVSATKSMTGHMLGAAGAIESIVSVLAIKNNVIPPTINLVERDPDINSDIQIVTNKPLFKTVNVAMNNTFGFGGHTVSTLYKAYTK